jgi:DNA-binding transcriptional ArsR family regulator
MANTAKFAEIALLAGEPTRAIMLHALMDGRALTASELASVAAITPQTASGHLARMTEAGLLNVVQQGRHRYHKLTSPAVAHMMESIMLVASAATGPVKNLRTGPRDLALRAGRTCYDHLAGRLGVALTDALVAQGHAELEPDVGAITESGQEFFKHLGIEIHTVGKTRSGNALRILCRPCLDWSERRAHLAGTVGTALCRHSFASGWIHRIEGTRAVTVTPKGSRIFREEFKMDLHETAAARR